MYSVKLIKSNSIKYYSFGNNFSVEIKNGVVTFLSYELTLKFRALCDEDEVKNKIETMFKTGMVSFNVSEE